jgi:cell division septation protein DedD
MRMKSFATTAGAAAALALALWTSPGPVQGQPLYDRIHVNLPYKIMLGDKTLEPGDYTIQQLPDQGGGSRVLLFYTDNGMKFETSAMSIPALDINTARDTKVVLNHVGDDYYINKIWVQGKDYGYELPMPRGLRERQNEKMTETTVAAQYQPAATDTTKTQTQTAQTTTPPPVTSQTEARPAQQDTTAQSNQATHPAETPTTTAAAAPPPAPTPTPAPDTSANTADRAAPEPAPATMPNTAANWLMMLLSGGSLSAAGLMLRRKQ